MSAEGERDEAPAACGCERPGGGAASGETLSPRDLGYAMPPEWAPQLGVWLVWPHNAETWPGRLEQVERAFAEMIDALAAVEHVFLVVPPEGGAARVGAQLADLGVPLAQVHLLEWPTDDSWVRDTGATFVVRERAAAGPSGAGRRRERAAVRWRFNAWGGKYPPWEQDAALAARMADWLGAPLFEAGAVLEGGAIEVNGRGSVLVTEQCLLHPNRNPGLGREQIERLLERCLGVEQVLWLEAGIAGDDTDGHVDDVARFVAPDTIVCAVESDPAHPNYHPLQANLERLHRFRDADGRPFRIIQLPMPPDVENERGELLPASYANFLIANGTVLVPAFEPRADVEAMHVLQSALPRHQLVPIPSRDLVLGLGAVHCLTQQVPAI
ncbi:MAG: agmatine deiminase [Planctomycetota bacterium]|nr:MAG: agmatine deiminase [Planctomycetota bacterium]